MPALIASCGDEQLDATEAAAGGLAQERRPERLGFGGTDVHAENFAAAVAVDADRDNHRDRHYAALLAHLHVSCVHKYGQSPSIGRARNAFTLSSISAHSRFTWLFEMPLLPIA